jgi:hypothetical protein
MRCTGRVVLASLLLTLVPMPAPMKSRCMTWVSPALESTKRTARSALPTTSPLNRVRGIREPNGSDGLFSLHAAMSTDFAWTTT